MMYTNKKLTNIKMLSHEKQLLLLADMLHRLVRPLESRLIERSFFLSFPNQRVYIDHSFQRSKIAQRSRSASNGSIFVEAERIHLQSHVEMHPWIETSISD